jgi:hypothetical protein
MRPGATCRARLRHAGRLFVAGGHVGSEELTTLQPEDFLGSRVFDPPETGV